MFYIIQLFPLKTETLLVSITILLYLGFAFLFKKYMYYMDLIYS